MRHRRLLLGCAWLGVVAAFVLVSTIVVGGAKAQPTSCTQPHRLPAGSRSPTEQLLLTAPDGEAVVLHFDDSRAPGVYSALLSADGGALLPGDFTSADGLGVRAGDSYIRKDSQHRISVNLGNQMTAKLIPISPHDVELCVRVQPNADGGVRPGRYKGTIFLVHGANQAQLATLPVELTFRASHWTGVEIAFIAVLLGLAVKVLSEAAVKQRQQQVAPLRALKDYMSELSFPVTLILAAVAGWLVFDQMYNNNPVWGANSGDTAKLFAICFIAQMSSNQGIDVIKNATGGMPAIGSTTTTNT
jgi:hypothetical protein